ncbi:unnamed protein product [Mycena citricolor]|uniref:Uncharacterized protein n=1 Tax=Mycena citricolor TaxID=2018698 RepID=A0AAD2K1B2_9AGAR|nr:unnamed protein product [Mycena citricolor]
MCRSWVWTQEKHSTCCIDSNYAWAEKLDIQELPQPIVACNANNTENISGRITHYVDLRMRIGPHVETRTFLLTCLGKAWIFIGLDWLMEHNPEVDWQEQTMRFSRCPERCHMRGHEEHQAMINMDAIDLDTVIGWLPDTLCTSSMRAYFCAFTEFTLEPLGVSCRG